MFVCVYVCMDIHIYVDVYGWHVETALRARTHAHVMRRVFSSACTPAPVRVCHSALADCSFCDAHTTTKTGGE